MRKPAADADGHLRLGWWPGNEGLKGTPLSLTKTSVTLDAGKADGEYQITWLDTVFDLQKGGIVEGTIKAAGQDNCAAGFVLDEGNGVSMAIQLGIGAPEQCETHIGSLRTDPNGEIGFESEDVTIGKSRLESWMGYATVTGVESGKEHTFRLLLRMGGFELYIDDLLMQTYIYKPSSGKAGLLAQNAEVMFGNLKAWSMSLPAETSFEMPAGR